MIIMTNPLYIINNINLFSDNNIIILLPIINYTYNNIILLPNINYN